MPTFTYFSQSCQLDQSGQKSLYFYTVATHITNIIAFMQKLMLIFSFSQEITNYAKKMYSQIVKSRSHNKYVSKRVILPFDFIIT